jgi:hypothetical protein
MTTATLWNKICSDPSNACEDRGTTATCPNLTLRTPHVTRLLIPPALLPGGKLIGDKGNLIRSVARQRIRLLLT